MPFDDFTWSARALSDQDLSFQRFQTMQIMHHLLYGTWSYAHAGVAMWEGHERALLAYQQAICCEWSLVRGYPDKYWDTTRAMFLDIVVDPMATPLIPPVWMGNIDLHISHQALLLRKDEEYYRKKFPGIRTHHELVWPGTLIKENT